MLWIIVIAVIAGFYLTAYALCQAAHDADEAMNRNMRASALRTAMAEKYHANLSETEVAELHRSRWDGD